MSKLHKSLQKIWYTYALLDPTKPSKVGFRYDDKTKFSYEPFYIGYGHKNRSSAHVKIAFKKNATGAYIDDTHKARKIRRLLLAGHEVIEIRTATLGTQKQAISREIELVALIGRRSLGAGPLTNMTDGGDGLCNPSRAVRAKMSAAKKGIPLSESHKQTLRTVRATPEYKARASAGQMGRKHSEETRAKMSSAHTGKEVSRETRDKMRQYEKTPEHRAALSKSLTGKVVSEETRLKISAANSGKAGIAHSEETKVKMRKPKSLQAVANMRKARQLRAQIERESGKPCNGKRVRIGSKIFNSVNDAAEYLGVKANTVSYRLKSNNFPDVNFA